VPRAAGTTGHRLANNDEHFPHRTEAHSDDRGQPGTGAAGTLEPHRTSIRAQLTQSRVRK